MNLHFITDFMSVPLFDLPVLCPLDWKNPIVWEGSVCHCFNTGAYTVTGTKGEEVGGIQGNHCGWKEGRLASQRGARLVKICEKYPGKEHQITPGPVLVLRDLDYSLSISEPQCFHLHSGVSYQSSPTSVIRAGRTIINKDTNK